MLLSRLACGMVESSALVLSLIGDWRSRVSGSMGGWQAGGQHRLEERRPSSACSGPSGLAFWLRLLSTMNLYFFQLQALGSVGLLAAGTQRSGGCRAFLLLGLRG